MAVDVIARGLGFKSKSTVDDLEGQILSGGYIVQRAYADQLGINIDQYYAKKTDIEHITVDIEAYTDEEIDSLLGLD